MSRAISQEELLRRMLRCGGISPDDAENAAVLDLMERHEREQQRVETLESDARLIGLAAHRTVGRADAGDGATCRWCGGKKFAHGDGCPVLVLMDIVMLVAAKTDDDRQISRNALERVQRKGGQ
uniref:Uncharacterized protein n=1 Tax=Desulfovibrio sp. U5L TaxID=596152 RepID=I2Q2Q8_9BACT